MFKTKTKFKPYGRIKAKKVHNKRIILSLFLYMSLVAVGMSIRTYFALANDLSNLHVWSIASIESTSTSDTPDVKSEVINLLIENEVNVDEAMVIIDCESKWNTEATRVNVGNTIDRGLWQINDYYHSEVSSACAYDPICSTKEAIRIYKQRGWQEWTCSDNL